MRARTMMRKIRLIPIVWLLALAALVGWTGHARATPSAINLGNVPINTTKTDPFTVTLPGNSFLLDYSGTGTTAPFSVGSGTCTQASTGSCTSYESFTPTALGPASGMVTIEVCTTTCTPQNIAVSGTGISLFLASLTNTNFGTVQLGQTVTRPVTVTLDTNYFLFGASGTGTNPPFALNFGTCSQSSTGSCTLYESFTPTVLGPASGQLSVSECSSSCIVATANLSGVAVVPEPRSVVLFATMLLLVAAVRLLGRRGSGGPLARHGGRRAKVLMV